MNSSMKSLFLVILLLNILLVPIGANVIGIAEFTKHIKGVAKFIFDGEMKIIVNVKDGLDVGLVYPFHIHEFPVRNHNCSTAGGHLDPTNAAVEGKLYMCDPNQPKKCEVGDLSGKYGGLIPNIKGHVHKQINDPFVKIFGSFGIRGRSIVIHKPDLNKTRLDCANIKIVHNHKRSLTRLI
ncbi:uncharacterized protein OCT59_011387 [Rhizophagus irregularis]|uniref:Cu,Zn superoxide dismutase-like protein n=5 Tax=Rhizophagus irregularis TaxID=588596 RepID=A0A2N1N935_9GLOM|nr:superoxide dismutase [Rhizophagus irregularis DAOM 181602=DAOM 197198]EXX52331.1 hypothetical protein RirG_253800 [Rhizophagus irregularis DAOM 197198w]PKK70413.1 Cu,Zn superoxide dismutase-like protein [Rhizophagus irregularis]POG70865.1 superoxide dismutase [Rhizophagus irregularis DAOM 181602=DAOM 197198]UZO20129.1 hypothetical protein OCT59_011387 [Rhizophagus irregularis]CAB4378333.1 unnamed protein product [Rhizophagus irregularis]|eukprot:XP_025177731.1 superoxide dismutase [Rhizophagus irregularis DAOM 181602=DAOM 197198]